jgi:glutathione S-transferase
MSPWVALATVGALLLYMFVTIKVGSARAKYGVPAPAMTGNPDFERVVRVHYNTLEQLVVFLPALWLFGHFVSARYAAALGFVWIVGRALYAWGYYQAADKRGPGFGIAILATIILVLGSAAGIIRTLIQG